MPIYLGWIDKRYLPESGSRYHAALWSLNNSPEMLEMVDHYCKAENEKKEYLDIFYVVIALPRNPDHDRKLIINESIINLVKMRDTKGETE